MARSVNVWGDVLGVAAIAAAGVAALAGVDDPLAVGATVLTVAAALAIPVVWGGLQGAGRFGSSRRARLFAGTRLAAGLAIALAGGSVGAVMIGVAGATTLTLVLSALPIRSALPGRSRRRQAVARDARQRRRRPRPDRALGARVQRPARRAARVLGRRGGRLRRRRGRLEGAPARAHRGDDRPLSSRRGAPRPRPRAAAPPGGPRPSSPQPRRCSPRSRGSSPEPLIDLLFGSEYEAADAWLGPLCLAMALYGLAIVYLYHFLALGRARVAVVLAAAAGRPDRGLRALPRRAVPADRRADRVRRSRPSSPARRGITYGDERD